MFDSNRTDGLVACEECGAPHHGGTIDADGEADCPQCGNDSFTALSVPSNL